MMTVPPSKPPVGNGLRIHFRDLIRPQLLIHFQPCPLGADIFSPNASATRHDYKELYVVRHEEGWMARSSSPSPSSSGHSPAC